MPLPWRRVSIEQKIPLLIASVLLVVTVIFTAGAYHEIAEAEKEVAFRRLGRVMEQLSTMLGAAAQQLITTSDTFSSHAVFSDFSRAPSAAVNRARLDDTLRAFGKRSNNLVATEVWDRSLERLMVSGPELPPVEAGLLRRLSDSAAASKHTVVGPLELVRDTILLSLVSPIRQGDTVLGFLIQRRRAASGPKDATQLASLMGTDARLLVGNADGHLWSDFFSRTESLPVAVIDSGQRLRYHRAGAEVLSRGAKVANTPWVVALEYPRTRALEGARAFIMRGMGLSALLLIVGSWAGWLLSRRITVPLLQLTDAAAALAEGKATPAPPIHRGDEIGQLAETFNTMATRVRTAQEELQRLNAVLEDRVQERTAQLETTNHELEAFSYSVSHDLRAPLRAVDGFSEILETDHAAQLNPEARRVLGVVRSNAQRMGRLIDDLLGFARLGRQQLVTSQVNMDQLAHTAIEEARQAAGARPIAFEVQSLPAAKGDMPLLRQVFSNLVSNAVKFTRGTTEARVQVGHYVNDGHGVYFVRDNGAGFDPKYADKLFGVFQRLHREDEFEGTGVGLALVQRIVHRHGGRVWAEGAVGRGATFYFTIPTGGHAT